MRVDVYLNLHKTRQQDRKIYSIKNKKTNRVEKHMSHGFFIKDATFVVSQAGRNRVIESNSKNVHAFVRGQLEFGLMPTKEAVAYYNPYLYDSFVDFVSKEKITQSSLVYFCEDGKIYYRR